MDREVVKGLGETENLQMESEDERGRMAQPRSRSEWIMVS